MDEFVERKQRLKRGGAVQQQHSGNKQQSKLKKRGKSSKKRTKNAWYENDSSDEFRTAAKTEDVGVGISKSQRACSKGKQNLFAELSSSESEYESADVDHANESQRPPKPKKSPKKSLDAADDEEVNRNGWATPEPKLENSDQAANDWRRERVTMEGKEENTARKSRDAAKSESEMSDHSLVIDERKTMDETRNSDDEGDNQYERTFELDDLYREDSTDAESDGEENETVAPTGQKGTPAAETLRKNASLSEVTCANAKNDYVPEKELIPLEEALDLLDRHEDFDPKSQSVRAEVAQAESAQLLNGIIGTIVLEEEEEEEASNDGILQEEPDERKRLSPTEMPDEKEDDDLPVLPEKLSSNEKPQKESDNLPLHVFLSRKVQESKKRKQQQLDKLREEQERILMDFQPTRRQRKCAIGKQGLLAEISSSDEESYARDNSKRSSDRAEHENKLRKKRESKEKRKERYIEKKHEQMIAKEQKAIEEEILREVGKRKEILAQGDILSDSDNATEAKATLPGQTQKKKHQTKDRQKIIDEEKDADESAEECSDHSPLDTSDDNHDKTESAAEIDGCPLPPTKRKKHSKSPTRSSKKTSKADNASNPMNKQRSKQSSVEKSKSRSTSASNKDSKERKSSNGRRDSDDEELKTYKSWNKVEEGVGVAIGRRKRTAALQLYYWSSSSDEEEPEPEPVAAPEEEEEDDRQEQHGWIVGDSHKRMITMLAMEKQLKEKRRRSEDEVESGKGKSKKHRNSIS